MYASEKLESAEGERSGSSAFGGWESAGAVTRVGSGADSICVEVILNTGSVCFWSTGIIEGSGGWTGRGESGDNVFV